MLEKGRIIFRRCCCSGPGQSGVQLEKRFEWTPVTAKDMAEGRRIIGTGPLEVKSKIHQSQYTDHR